MKNAKVMSRSFSQVPMNAISKSKCVGEPDYSMMMKMAMVVVVVVKVIGVAVVLVMVE